MTTLTWRTGVALRSSKPAARLVIISNPEPESWTKKLFMRNRNTLGDRIRRGEIRSAWDDYETDEDAFAGRVSSEKVADAKKIQEEFDRLRREREEAKRAQEEKMRLAREAEERRRAAEAQEQLERLEGYGSF